MRSWLKNKHSYAPGCTGVLPDQFTYKEVFMLEAIAQNSAQAYRTFRLFDDMRRDFLRTYGFSVLMLIFALISLAIRSYVFFAIMAGFAILYPLLRLLTARSSAKALVKENPGYEKISVRYVFSVQDMSVLASHERTPTTYAYTDFYMVYETNEYFYFYINPKESLILPKDSFRVGKSEDLTRILKAHLLPIRKYVRRK